MSSMRYRERLYCTLTPTCDQRLLKVAFVPTVNIEKENILERNDSAEMNAP